MADSPFIEQKKKLGYKKSKGSYRCGNCQRRIDSRHGTYCQSVGYDPSDPESNIKLDHVCKHHKMGNLTTLEEEVGQWR